MPKLKTKSSVKKRYKITKNGKLKRKKAFKSHILTKKSKKRKRHLKMPKVCGKSETKFIKATLPYGR